MAAEETLESASNQEQIFYDNKLNHTDTRIERSTLDILKGGRAPWKHETLTRNRLRKQRWGREEQRESQKVGMRMKRREVRST